MNLPWAVVDLSDSWTFRVDGQVAFPWGITDSWGVVIGRFDTKNQAQQAADAANEFFVVHSG